MKKRAITFLTVSPFSATCYASQHNVLWFSKQDFVSFYIESIEINHLTILIESTFAESVIATGLAV